MNRTLSWVVSLLLALACRASASGSDDFKSGVVGAPRGGADITLGGWERCPEGLAQYRGKVVILEFGFTYCQRVCPVTLANLTQVWKKLGDAASEVQLIFVTVDPERDSPERLREYLAYFNPAFVGATGTAEQLDAVRRAYGIVATRAVSEDKKLGYEVHHSSSLHLIDREGKLRALVPFGQRPDDVVHDLKLLLLKK
jgi:protein SCO1/2